MHKSGSCFDTASDTAQRRLCPTLHCLARAVNFRVDEGAA